MKQSEMLLLIGLVAINYLSHLFTDYVIQTNQVVEKKLENNKSGYIILFFKHIIPGFIVNLISSILFLYTYFDFKLIIIWDSILKITTILFVLWMVHMLTDTIKIIVIKNLTHNRHLEWVSYILDQVIHFIEVCISSYLMFLCTKHFIPLADKNNNINIIVVLIIICSILLNTRFAQFLIAKVLSSNTHEILKEHNYYITIKNISLCEAKLNHYQNKSEIKENDLASGTTIGIMERLLILFGVFNENTLTAILAGIIALKSVTRFDKISKDSKYAEYYLLGSLLSILIALIISFISLLIVKYLKNM